MSTKSNVSVEANRDTQLAELQRLLDQGLGLSSVQWTYKTTKWSHAVATLTSQATTLIAIGAADDHVHVLNERGECIWTYCVNERAKRIAVGDLSGDGEDDLVVGSYDRYVYALTAEGDLLWRFSAESKVEGVHTVDLNDDGRIEIAIATRSGSLFVVDSAGKERWRRRFDRRLESVSSVWIAGQNHLLVSEKDGGAHLLLGSDSQSRRLVDIGVDILDFATTDLNGDNQAEIVFGSGAPKVHAIDVTGRSLWEFPARGANGRVFAVLADDVNGDGTPEIIAGSGDGHVYILDRDGHLEWQIRIPARVRDVAILRCESGAFDLIVAMEDYRVDCYRVEPYLSQRQAILELCAQLEPTEEERARLSPLEEDLLAGLLNLPLTVADKPARVMPRISLSACEQVYQQGDYFKALSMFSQLQQVRLSYVWHQTFGDWVHAVCGADINQDGAQEILAGTRDGHLYALSHMGELLWEKELGEEVRSIHARSPTKTGLALVVGTEEGRVFGFDRQGNVKWDLSVEGSVRGICIVPWQLDEFEVLAGSMGRAVYRVNEDGRVRLAYPMNDKIATVAAIDINNDGQVELIAGGEDRTVYVFDRDNRPMWQFTAGDRIKDVHASDIDDDGQPEILVACSLASPGEVRSRENLYVLDPMGRVKWMYGTRGWNLRVYVSDVDNDHRSEVLVASGDQHLYVLDNQGGLRCKIPTDAWVRDVYAADIDGDGRREIIIGVEDHNVYTLKMLNEEEEHQVTEWIDVCWSELGKTYDAELVHHCLRSEDAFLRGQAVRHLADLQDQPEISRIFERMCYDDSPYVRIQCIQMLPELLRADREALQALPGILVSDRDADVRSAIVNVLSDLPIPDPDRNQLVEQLVRDEDALVRRELPPVLVELTANQKQWAFDHLCSLMRDESTWIQHEIARALANLATKDSDIVLELISLTLDRDSLQAIEFLTYLIDDEILRQVLNSYIALVGSYEHQEIVKLLDEAVTGLQALDSNFAQEQARLLEIFRTIIDRQSLDDEVQKLSLLSKQLKQLLAWAEAPRLSPPHLTETWERLDEFARTVTAYNQATSQVTQQRLLLTANEQLVALGERIGQVPHPARPLLVLVVVHWHRLLAASGRALVRAEEIGPVVNPYVVANPVIGGLFVGREDTLQRLGELWGGTGQKPSVVIYGHRRMGKSSILHSLGARFGPHTSIVDFNMQRVGLVASTGELLYNLALALYDAQTSEVWGTSEVLEEPEEERFTAHNPYTAFDRFFKRLDRVRAERRFIVTVDEFELIEQGIVEGQLEPRLLDFWRGLIQTYPWFIMAFAGLHTLQEMTQDYWHPLYGSVTAVPVSFLTHDAAWRLITQPTPDFPLDYDADAVERIIVLTHGQPYLVQLIGHGLVTRFNRQTFGEGIERERRFILADVEAVIGAPEFYRDGDAYFTGVWRQAETSEPPGQTAVLCALARSEAGMPVEEIAHQASLAPEEVIRALETLARHDVVMETDGRWQFTVELMRRWVAQR